MKSEANYQDLLDSQARSVSPVEAGGGGVTTNTNINPNALNLLRPCEL